MHNRNDCNGAGMNAGMVRHTPLPPLCIQHYLFQSQGGIFGDIVSHDRNQLFIFEGDFFITFHLPKIGLDALDHLEG